MISGPDEEGGVIVRGLGSKDFPGEGVVVQASGRDEDTQVEVVKGEVVVARWSDVKEFVEKGEMELV